MAGRKVDMFTWDLTREAATDEAHIVKLKKEVKDLKKKIRRGEAPPIDKAPD